jgi:hypothetical protein
MLNIEYGIAAAAGTRLYPKRGIMIMLLIITSSSY